jgi:hypothetical protein
MDFVIDCDDATACKAVGFFGPTFPDLTDFKGCFASYCGHDCTSVFNSSRTMFQSRGASIPILAETPVLEIRTKQSLISFPRLSLMVIRSFARRVKTNTVHSFENKTCDRSLGATDHRVAGRDRSQVNKNA